MELIIDDMEHNVRKVIAEHRDDPGFPKIEDYGVTEEDFDDYLFYKQAIIDDVDSLRKKYTIYSIIFILPFVVMAFFKTTMLNFLIGLGCGFVLCLIYYVITIIVNYVRMHSLKNESIERYITDVMAFKDR